MGKVAAKEAGKVAAKYGGKAVAKNVAKAALLGGVSYGVTALIVAAL